MLLPFQGATAPTRGTQSVASLALGWVLLWAFSPPLLNPKLESDVCIFCSMIVRCLNAFALSGRHYISSCEPRVSLRLPWAMCLLGLQPALAKFET